MKRGLIIGKFMPVHQGHVALIQFAALQCDELIVSMSFTVSDPISASLRFSWLREIFAPSRSIKLYMVKDDFDDESLPLFERTKHWSEFIKHTYPPVDFLFASENYGIPLAQHLGARYIPFDHERIQYPVSATKIRQHPYACWDFIPVPVRPYFVKKICFYGPESTGKSTMAREMAALYATEYVPEMARELITSNNFTPEDFIEIGNAQVLQVEEKLKTANKIVFCDTDTITTQIYSRHYLDHIPPELFELEKRVSYDFYFLLDIDVPWVADGLRDLLEQREEMFAVFKSELHKRGISYTLVQGSYEERSAVVRREIDRLLS